MSTLEPVFVAAEDGHHLGEGDLGRTAPASTAASF